MARPSGATLTGAGWTLVYNTLYQKQFTSVLAQIDIGNGQPLTGVTSLQEAIPNQAMAAADVASAVSGIVAVGASAPVQGGNADRGPNTYSYSATY